MTFDESGVYTRGVLLGHSLAHGDWDRLAVKTSPDDGLVVYDHLYSLLLYLFNPACDIDVYHWLNMAFALLAFAAAFEMLLAQYQRPWLALLGPLFLFLTPRFLGDIPANPKDMPFAVFYFLALGGIYFFSRRTKTSPYAKVLFLGLLFGLTQCSRILGFSLYLVYLLFDLHFYYHGTARHSLAKSRAYGWKLLKELAGIFLVANALMFATWPYLRRDPFHHLADILALSRNFRWENPVLFFGHEILAPNLPLSYLPVWLLITTPLFILFFLGGAWFFLKGKNKNRLLILMAAALGVNLALYGALRPVVYDGLRHFLFLLPPLTLLAAMAALEFTLAYRASRTGILVTALCLLDVFAVLSHFVNLHPYEYLYFNELTGGLKGAEGKFETDYWGASFKEAVDWMEANETKDLQRTYRVALSGNSYQLLTYATPNLTWVEKPEEADYYLATTRDNKHKLVDPSKAVHVVEREKVPLCYVFKLKRP